MDRTTEEQTPPLCGVFYALLKVCYWPTADISLFLIIHYSLLIIHCLYTVCLSPSGFHAGAITFGISERFNKRAGDTVNSP